MRTTGKANWLRRLGPIGLAGLLALPAAAEVTETAGRSSADVARVQQERVQLELNQLDDKLKTARDHSAKEDFAAADALYQEVAAGLKKLQGDAAAARRAAWQEEYRQFQVAWASVLMSQARDLAADGKYAEAIRQAQQAQLKDPDRKSIAAFMEECQKRSLAADFRKATSLEAVSPEYAARKSEIDLNLREAKLFFRNNQLESACTRLERVLLIDPFNVDAIEMLNLIYNRLYRTGKNRTNADVINALARDTWEWMEPLGDVQVDRALNRAAAVHKRANTDLYTRMERIVFPGVPLADSTIADIIRYLNEKSRVYDPQHQGVSIIDNLPATEKQRKISFELGKTPLLDIVRYLSLATGLSYTLRGDTVVFGNVDNMSTEFFPVRGDIISQIIDSQKDSVASLTESAGLGGGGEGGKSGGEGGKSSGGSGGKSSGKSSGGSGGKSGGDGIGQNEVTTATAGGSKASEQAAQNQLNSLALKSYFQSRWINFDNGALISYSPLGQRLVVKNTTENLQRMDALLRQLDALEQPMVLVETKMIELNDTNLDELGFSWSFSASKNDGSWSMGITDPLRHGDTGTNDGNLFRVLNNLKILPNFGEKIFGSDVNVDLSLSINAVAQNRRAEVLSSPRVISNSGKKAEIAMVEHTSFITEWEEPEIEIGGMNTILLTNSEPDWEEKDLGITFEVTPTVGNDHTIKLEKLKPLFYTHTGDEDNWITYRARRVSKDGTSRTLAGATYNLKMPILARREINATLTVSDGETVLIGGMIDNQNSSREDRWPILGDLPLVGRFFRDQQSNVINRSLLIFVTARLVDSRGVPLRSVRERGILDFNR